MEVLIPSLTLIVKQDQPEWRLADDGSFNYETPKDEDWCILHKGGSAGLYIVVVALSWWIRALRPDIPSFHAWTAVHDVQWVIDQIMKRLITPAGKKYALEDSTQSSKAKRYVSDTYNNIVYSSIFRGH